MLKAHSEGDGNGAGDDGGELALGHCGVGDERPLGRLSRAAAAAAAGGRLLVSRLLLLAVPAFCPAQEGPTAGLRLLPLLLEDNAPRPSRLQPDHGCGRAAAADEG
jgi:hypothetical protein